MNVVFLPEAAAIARERRARRSRATASTTIRRADSSGNERRETGVLWPYLADDFIADGASAAYTSLAESMRKFIPPGRLPP